MRMIPAPTLAALLLLAVPATGARAAESYDSCTGFINSLPATISTQGTWCMNKDLATGITSGAAITIAANNVTLDCNHFKLGGLAAGTGTTTTGILSEDRLNNVVRRCNVRGFRRGISFTGASSNGHSVEDNRFESNYQAALWLAGDDLQVRRNYIIETGLAPVFINSFGIYVLGEADVIDNTVDGVYYNFNAQNANIHGIVVDNPGYSVIEGNRVRNIQGGAADAYGIRVNGTGHAIVAGNTVTGGNGTVTRAIICIGGTEASVVDNTMANYLEGIDDPDGIEGCTTLYGNIFKPWML